MSYNWIRSVANSISIVVPIHNEVAIADALKERLARLDVYEVIIVDGGSTDGTWETLKRAESPSLQLIRAGTGRARQMNHGALRATGDVLLFLHADTCLPPRAGQLVDEALHSSGRCWGRFDVRFDRCGALLRTVARAMNLRSAWTSICTGDQAMFAERGAFRAVGGFAPIELMEDVDLSRRLKRRSPAARIRTPVVTSSRRWRDNGVCRTIGLMWWLRWLYWWGVSPAKLAARYNAGSRWTPS